MEGGYKSMNGTQLGGKHLQLGRSANGQPRATYSNQGQEDYLTPTSPLPPQLPAFPPGFSPAQSPVRKEPLPRADSGIESLPRSPTSSISTAPRTSTLYEYIDPNYAEPDARDGGSGQSSQPPATPSPSTASTNSTYLTPADRLTDHHQCHSPENNAQRRRINPLYETLEQCAAHTYAHTYGPVCGCNKLQAAGRGGPGLRCLWCTVLVLFLLTASLLTLTAYVLFKVVPDLQNDVAVQTDRLAHVETRFSALYQENQVLQQYFSSNHSDTVSAGSGAGFVSPIAQLNESMVTFDTQLQMLRSELQVQIANISLRQGPQGPAGLPGVGNLSSCYYRNRSALHALPGGSGTTIWMPSLQDLQENIVMSAACGVEEGTQQSLESNVISDNVVQFRCLCGGSLQPMADYRKCVLHLIMCPRVTAVNTPA